MADVELKRREFSSGEDIPEPNSLLMGLNQSSPIKIVGPVDLVRGELLMSDSDGNFVTATKDGIINAKEICILAEDILISSSNEYVESVGVFEGAVNKNALVFSWETTESVHDDEIKDIRAILRQHRIFPF